MAEHTTQGRNVLFLERLLDSSTEVADDGVGRIGVPI